MDYSNNNDSRLEVGQLIEGLERATDRLEPKFNSIVDSPHAVMFVKDLEGRYAVVNENFLKRFSLSREEIVGKTDFELFPEQALLFREKDREVRECREPRQLEERVTALDGTVKTFVTVKFPLFSPDGKVYGTCGIATEISELVQAREELRRAKEEAKAANRAKSEFLAHVSHELRTPLSVIVGYSEILANGDRTLDEEKQYLNAILRNSSHLLELINDTLEVSKLEADKMEYKTMWFDPLAEIRTAIVMLEGKAQESGVTLSFNLPLHVRTASPMLHADPLRFRQILINLISNAIKFTDRGGAVTVSLRVDRDCTPNRLQIDVSDTGRGIAEHEQENLFRPFSQANSEIASRYGGSGLGLSLSRRMAQDLGGRLWLSRSHLGLGSTFSLEFEVT